MRWSCARPKKSDCFSSEILQKNTELELVVSDSPKKLAVRPG